ncbi:eukaryotic translation initiation factor 3 subunit M-like [Amphiura filiformis]|uniref:eukaryotic translation initiation factor 3 subunit M-like n=1 Tax=Amphiura filiformis TaxID=82378 RepID=UPI003B2287C6
MSLPAFIDVPETEQAGEIRSYLQSLGAEIKESSAGEDMYSDLEDIIPATGVLWKVQDDAAVEGILNSILSLLIYQPPEELEHLCKLMSENLSKATSREKANIRLKILTNLFHGVGESSIIAYPIYCGLLKVAAQAGTIENITTDLDLVKKLIDNWQLSREKTNNVLRLLYEALKESKQSQAAGKVMVELLGTYTEDNASAARDDAHRCIVNSLADPNTYLFDHLLTLRPVKFLEGELIHELLTIFVSGSMDDYQAFFNAHQDFVKSVGLSHEENIRKMRILTFLSMAVEQKEIPYATIEQDLKISEDQIEEFVIDVIKTRMARGKIDQLQKKVNISYVTHRTFGKQQWQQLHKQLEEWQQNLSHVRGRLETLALPQIPSDPQ